MKVIKAIEFANGLPCEIAGQYLKSFDFEAYGGRGFAVYTLDVNEAMKFPGTGEAMQFWRTQSKLKPLRADGKPNRPLTSTTIEILDAP